MWVTILVLCTPALLTHGTEEYDAEDGLKIAQCHFSSAYKHIEVLYTVCFLLASYVVPLTLVFILYVLMLKRLWFGAVPGGHMSSESVRSKKRVTRMVVVVVVIFAVCWCPIQIILVMRVSTR